MKLNCAEISTRCAKTLLITLNIMIIMVSLLTFAFAIADVRILKRYGDQQTGSSIVGDVVVVFACSLVMTVAIVGCIGTVRGNIKMLYVYIGMLMTLAVFELLIVIYVVVQRYGLQIRVSEWIRNDFFANTTEENVEAHQHLWDIMQTRYSCCGLNGPDDYAAIKQPISLSCCKRAYLARTAQAQQAMYKSCLDSDTYYDAGCEDEILKTLESEAEYLLGVAVFTMWLEAISMMLAVWVTNQLKNAVHVYKEAVKY